MPYRRRRSCGLRVSPLFVSLACFAVGGYFLWTMFSPPVEYAATQRELSNDVVSSSDKPESNSPPDPFRLASEWRRIKGGNLRDEGLASDMAEWLDALTKRGPAYRRLKEQAPLSGPWRDKLELMHKILSSYGLSSEIYSELR